jgi:hypothetical protein
MADSIFGDIANVVGGTLSPEIAEVFKGLPQHIGEILATPIGSLGQMMDDLHLQPLVEALQVDISPHTGDATTAAVDGVTGAVDATAEPTPFVLPAGVEWSEVQGHLEGLADKLQSLDGDAQAKLTSADPAEQAQGQLMIQQSQALMEQVQSLLQHMSDTTVEAIQDLHSDAGSGHDAQGQVVAIADSGDGHVVGHADQDASADHQVDHVSAPPAAHDDGATADPSASA